MTEQIEMPEEFTAPRGAGPQLRLAREKLGLSIKELADRTRIPLRHITSIEAGEFASLPGRAYAVGFARTMARETGLDEEGIVEKVSAELDSFGPNPRVLRETYEPGDPARAPSRQLVWFSVAAGILLLAGLYMAARLLFAPAAELPPLVEEQEVVPTTATGPGGQPASATDGDPAGAVTFTAQGAVWVRITDAGGRRLIEGEMVQGDTFTLPADAEGPRIITGRPDLLAITVGTRAVPALSTEPLTVSDLPVDAASLLARPAPAPAAAPTSAPTPAPAPAPAPTPAPSSTIGATSPATR